MHRFNLSRYEQHVELPRVGIEGQKKLHAAKVLIVGSGGLGCPIALYLTAAGVGKIGLVDADHVEESNLQRQILFNNEDIQKQKVTAAKEKLDKLAHYQNIEAYPFFLDEKNAEDLIADYDVVIDATDNHIARLSINETCLKLGKPWVYGALFHFEGQLMVFNLHKDAPCFKCVFHNINEDSSLPTCKLAGILSTVPGVIGCMQATEALKIILDSQTRQDRGALHIINLLTYDMRTITVSKNPKCKTCSNDDC